MAKRTGGRDSIARLIERFEEVVDEERAEQDAVRMLKGMFDLNDFFEQIRVLKEMGSLREMAHEIPGVPESLPEGTEIDDEELVRIGAMISSMTEDERRQPDRFRLTNREIDTSRVRRVARGSGREEQDVADLLDRFTRMRQMMMEIGRSTGLR